jgi:glycosyltransferase involved in cell wall biosynthesis
LHREPVLIREKLLVHRVRSGSNASAPRRNTNEHAAIIRKQLLRLWSGARPANPLADVFEAHGFLFGQSGWSQALNEAFDGLLEYRDPPDERPAHGVAPVQVAPADCPHEFTLVTHELSLTGAPVIVLEIASLLRERGCRVKVLSLSDGPLRAEFTKRGIRTVTPPLLLDRIARLHVRTLHWAMRGKQFPEKFVNRLIGALRKFSGWAWQLQIWVHARGILLVNSVAAWPVATQLPVTWRRPAFWYIHETLDLQWLIPGEETSSRLRQLVAGGRLKMLYGSEATRLHWAANHYDGRLRYWSGVSKTTDYLGPASDRGREQQRARRVILNIGMVGGRKGTRTLVEAFALGRAEGLIPADVELCIVGCQLPSEHLEARDLVRRIYQPDLRGHVRAVHSVKPGVLRSYYREADVYAHASIFDCMPIALLTAMAHGLPIVATDVDGCKEAIEHETSGLLVQHGKPRQMAEALGRLLAEPDRARALGTAARARFIEHFSAEATFGPLYDTLTGRASVG